jgi:hypothetical protein
MSETDPLPFRVYSETDGKVYLLYEPQNWRVEVETPVTAESLEAARLKLGKLGSQELRDQFRVCEGDSYESATPQQRANREIKAVVVPQKSFLTFVSRMAEGFFEGLFLVLGAAVCVYPVYKVVEYSQDLLPEPVHLMILFVVAIGLALSIYTVATQEKELKDSKYFKFLFGKGGLLVLPCLNLVGAASVFASLTLSLYNHQKLVLEPCAGRPVGPGSLLDFYMWHLLKLVPLLKLNETLKWGEPLCYRQGRVGALILLFQALVVLPCINAIRYYFKNRKLAMTPYKYIYEPGWTPEGELKQ